MASAATAIRRLSRYGEGEPARQMDWDEVQIHNAERIDQAVLEVQETSQAHKVAKIGVSNFVTSRSVATTGLRKRHSAHQKIFNGSCGPRGLTLTGLDAPPDTTMLGMREQSILVHKRYGDPSLPGELAAIPKEETNGPVPDLPTLSQELKGDIGTFETAQDGWTHARKVRDEAYVAKQAAQKRLRRIVVNVARVQEGYYRMAGLDELADRLRLTVRGSRKKKAKAPDVPPKGPDDSPKADETGDSPSEVSLTPPVKESLSNMS